ncbi:flagellar biosynthetic protein FliR [Nocardioides sp. URHA0020]|uniref:flagellar biosynthetic protein FliR n=1 Tax=Nocardioides sp. URHA0020 TaxID=1380392 RepID=UPI00048B3622|nr:flagellar biosynthetic protein FliR [Nocardioides sp. URHA0020]
MTLTISGEPLVAYLLASVRIVAWLAVVPPFSGRTVPSMVKVVVSLGLAFAVVPNGDSIPLDTVGLLLNVATQVLIGVAMGFVTYLLLAAIAAAGSLIDVFGGFSLAQGFDPLSMNSTTVFGKFHQMLATVLLFVSGGHLMVIGGLLQTFKFLPLGTSPDWSSAPDVFLTAFGLFFTTAVQIALPMIAVLFLADVGLALLTKVAPQMQAMTVMFPVKIGLTLLLVGLSFPVIPHALDRMVDLSTQAMSTLSGVG